jgi:hypothetical protein
VTAHLYWYPEDDGLVRALDLGIGWRELVAADGGDLVAARSADGQRIVTTFTTMRRVRGLVEYVTDAAVVRELYAIGNHLTRNGVIGLAEEDGATWGGFARSAPEQGETVLKIEDNLWEGWSTADLAIGDTVIIQGASPGGKWEEAVLADINGPKRKITLSSGLRYDYSTEPYVFIRDARFWPFLRLQDGALQTAPIRTDHRITWALELELEEPPSRLARAAERGTRFRGTSGAPLGQESYGEDYDAGDAVAGATTTVRW